MHSNRPSYILSNRTSQGYGHTLDVVSAFVATGNIVAAFLFEPPLPEKTSLWNVQGLVLVMLK
ncbi:hypothetical protein SpAn4DRAFT_2650 [Sporomusa ovata]|uniref:Uncharacterized protein n=1 Tax=Sporomusa ovata TaxID=2378 RepID=A0A0U1L159_9FIRM|nr:hypothetical protein SpAn4DRAFT_2650 [Sporomusa ovata]